MPHLPQAASRHRTRAWVLAGSWVLAFAVGCFNAPPEPPTYRFACESDDECEGEEACIGGLCQVPCTLNVEDFSSDCPPEYAICFNGVCSSLCLVDENRCPEQQECIDLAPYEVQGLDEGTGLCGVLCTKPGEQSTCPDGHVCIDGGICITEGGSSETDTDGDTDGGTTG